MPVLRSLTHARHLHVILLASIVVAPSVLADGPPASAQDIAPQGQCQDFDVLPASVRAALCNEQSWQPPHVVMHENPVDKSVLRSKITGSITAPVSVLDGQRFPVGIRVWSEDPFEGAVVQIVPSMENVQGGQCSANSFELTGGTPLGMNYYLIAPQRDELGIPDDMPVATGEIRFDWTIQSSNPGQCKFSVAITNPVIAVANQLLERSVDILPDISTDPIGLGHIQTVGGQTKADTAKIISSAAAASVQVLTARDHALAVVEATISHHDGWSWDDWGEFTITPGADSALLKDLAEYLPVPAGEILWHMDLADSIDKVFWTTLVTLDAAVATEENPRGQLNKVCMKGQYVDSGDRKGSARSCVDVYVEKVPEVALVGDADLSDYPLADEILHRTGAVFFQLEPGRFAFVSQADVAQDADAEQEAKG